jgi:cytochrome b6-f complex iron-sulfur subunit
MGDDHHDDDGAPPRRDFLGKAISTTAAALGVMAIYPVVKFVQPLEESSPNTVKVGEAEKFPRGTSRMVVLGGAPVLVLRLDDGNFRAFKALCTHLNCVVAFSAAHKQIECRCHNGVYSLEGKNVSGPPPRPLEKVAVSVVQGMVVISEA